ncbi:hypothetical protein BDK51DRAFT_29856 [Blyttiomyces helicus]|uniref:Uncharacterized protein n=1 Tax=Blyttiomyces helicus TaxID=388810 RepID=A0A4P9WDV5_9FUNG|nr:hypothetical protein BDK51DRAFT_29856 [Blyttiomyces helicus]|eukprot:RKO90754.1 hypothetical protein BDK51DRAFT_29856 [Blyttiomyces helicus]
MPPTKFVQAKLDNFASQPTSVANGLAAGIYVSPIAKYIFAEPIPLGETFPPANFLDFPFLTRGQGPWLGADPTAPNLSGPLVGQLIPFPGLPANCQPIPAPPNCAGIVPLGNPNASTVLPPFANAGIAQESQKYQTFTFTVPKNLIVPFNFKFQFTATIFDANNNPIASSSDTTSVTVVTGPPQIPDTVAVTAAIFNGVKDSLTVTATSSDVTGTAELFFNVTRILPLPAVAPVPPVASVFNHTVVRMVRTVGAGGGPGAFSQVVVGIVDEFSNLDLSLVLGVPRGPAAGAGSVSPFWAVTVTSGLGGTATLPITIIKP